MALPDAVNDGSGNAEMAGHRSNPPVRAAVAGPGFQGGIEDLLFQFRGQYPPGPVASSDPGDGC